MASSNPQPPDLTLRYTHTNPLPADTSTSFFNITGIPHVKCFPAGKYVIVRLADKDYLKEHTNHATTTKLASHGFHLVDSAAARASRTLMIFRHNIDLTKYSLDQVKDEIETKNTVTVQDLTALRLKTPALKLRLTEQTDADRLKQQGIKAFSLIFPTYSSLI